MAVACSIYDLIDDIEAKEHKLDFTIVEEKGGRGIHARGLTEKVIHSEEEALNLLFRSAAAVHCMEALSTNTAGLQFGGRTSG